MTVFPQERASSRPILILGLGIAASVAGLSHRLGTGLPSLAFTLLGLLLGGVGIMLHGGPKGAVAATRRCWSGPNAWLLGSGAALLAGWWGISFALLLWSFWLLDRVSDHGSAGAGTSSFGSRLRELWLHHGGLLLGLGTLLLMLRVTEALSGPGGAKAHRLELGVAGSLLALLGVAWAGRTDGLRALAPGMQTTLTRRPGLPLRLAAAGLIPFGSFLLLAQLIRLPAVQAFDVELLQRAHRSGGELLTQFMKSISAAGGEDLVTYWLPAIALLLAVRRRAHALRFLLTLNLGVFGIQEISKTLVHRLRPEFTHGQHFDSFPSGHTLSAVLLAGALLLILLPRRQPARGLLCAAALAWPLLMGASRVYLGSHYLTDVIGSLLLGTAWVLGCLALLLLTAPQQAHAEQKVTADARR